jgi:outer membrane lipoprotein-sorting protein
VEYYDHKGALARRLTSGAVEKIKGYWVAREREMHDLAAGHRSRMVLTNIRFDSGLSDEIFTTRYLER